MQTIVRQAVVLLVATPIVACSYFGGGSSGPTATTAPKSDAPMTAASIGKLNSDCARLQPLYGSSDKELTREQMDAALKVEMAKWDKNNSGDLTNSEFEPLNDELRSENVGASPVTDWNGDGHVDFQEFASGWRTMFDLCDRNRNKVVSLRELGYSPSVVAPRTTEKPKQEKPQQPDGASSQRPGGY